MPEQLAAEAYEKRRAGLVRELGLMDDDNNQEAYDRIARLAKRIFGTEIVLITFMDSERQWFKSHLGTDMTQNRRDQSFCTHTIVQKKTLVVEDASADPRFRANPFVLGGPQIRFYAGEPLSTHDGHPVGTICLVDRRPRQFSQEDQDTLRDLADLVMTQVRVDRDLTYRDAATKMPNRIQFFADLRDFSRVHDDQSQWVVVIELVGLQESNEAVRALGLGYLYDQIAHAASVLRAVLGNRTIYHVGPTHLAFCLDGESDGLSILSAISTELRKPFATSSGIPAKLAPGCGVRRMTSTELGSPDVLRTLLQAAREARDNGRGVALYDPVADAAQKRAYSLVVEMPRALAENELFLVYQPRVDARTGLCSGAEALLRWKHPVLGVVSPAEFLPLITKTPLIREVTDWVMRSVCRQIAAWDAINLPIHCSFNISARNLEEDDFVGKLAAAIARTGVTPSQIEIELVEDVSVMEDETILARLNAIRDLGVVIAIDDFGSGYSNLAYLLELPATVLKIDRSIVAGILTKPSYATAVASIIAMGHQLGYRIVAEGVETEEIKDRLVEWGCDELQGYLFSKPLEVEAFEKWASNFSAKTACMS
ncbi:EAL domain-containing protein [Agrobacterium vitis]|nr:EAL domain-containing protein [Agrobacterium vitis]